MGREQDEAAAERGNVLAQTDADRTSYRFPVAVLNDVTAKDVDISLRFRPVSGGVDQAAGLVWRYQDANNYYIVRANALEGNVVLYKVENGKRTDLPLKGTGRTYGKKANVPKTPGVNGCDGARAAVHGVAQWSGTLRSGRQHVRRPGQGRRVDEGRFRHIFRRPDNGEVVRPQFAGGLALLRMVGCGRSGQ